MIIPTVSEIMLRALTKSSISHEEDGLHGKFFLKNMSKSNSVKTKKN